MTNVLYTAAQFSPSEIFDTQMFCGPNSQAMEAEGLIRSEVEAFLESVRALLTEEYRESTGRDLPGRNCGISTVIWPDNVGYNPPASGGRCYTVRPRSSEATWAVVDEDWVDLLMEEWPEARGTERAMELAELYWGGTPRHYGPGSSNLLIEGKVEVLADCPEEEEKIRGRRGVVPPRMRAPRSRSERISEERRYQKKYGIDAD